MELVQIIIPIILGLIFGIITGIIPGIHINLIATLILTNILYLNQIFIIEQIVIFIIAMSITHTFTDFIPSILFGIPNQDTSLSILPAHKMVLKGDALDAIFISATGSFLGIIFTILVLPIFALFLNFFYQYLKTFIPYILIFVSIFLILLEKQKNKIFWAIIITLFSSSFGLLILNSKITTEPLLLIFTGLFGISTLFFAIKNNNKNYPTQNFKIKTKINSKLIMPTLIGGICSSICSITPGIGNAQAATLSSIFFKKITTKQYLITISSINTINFALSIITLYLINRSRNGSIIVISQITKITFHNLILYYIIVIIVSIIAYILTIYISKKIIIIVTKLNMIKINFFILLFLFISIFLLTNFYGLLILLCSSSLGILTQFLNIKRIHLMNVLIIPVIFNLI